MLHKKLKKILFIASFISIFINFENKAIDARQQSQIEEQQIKATIIGTIALFGVLTGLVGTINIVKGITHFFDIPLSHEENIIFTKRFCMSKEDLEKHLIGNKIKASAEILLGLICLCGAYNSMLGSIQLAQTQIQ